MKNTSPLRPMPKTYRLCVKTDCPRSVQCLRSVALSMLSPDEQFIQIINPVYLTSLEGDCPVFHSAEKIRYARGFVKMLSGLTVAQANALRQALEHALGIPVTFVFAQASASSIPPRRSTSARQ